MTDIPAQGFLKIRALLSDKPLIKAIMNKVRFGLALKSDYFWTS